MHKAEPYATAVMGNSMVWRTSCIRRSRRERCAGGMGGAGRRALAARNSLAASWQAPRAASLRERCNCLATRMPNSRSVLARSRASAVSIDSSIFVYLYRRNSEGLRPGKMPASVRWVLYCANAASTDLTRSAASGVTADSKRLITLPFLSTRNLVKFHLISPPVLGLADLSVRYWYSGVVSVPFTETLLIIGNVTL